MTRRVRPLLAVPTVAGLILLSSCGDDAPEGDAAPSSPASAGETTVAPEGGSGSDQQAGLSFEDQPGDGSSVVVETVSAPQGGFLVITPAGADTVLGSVQLEVGTTFGAEVSLDAPLPADTTLTATLHADTDGDGQFDPAIDQAVPAPSSGADPSDDVSDGSDVVDDDAEYTLG